MSENYAAYAKRLMRKLEVLRLDAKHRKQEQLVHDLGECLTLLAKMEKNLDRNIFDITDSSQ
jgi:hypothetical protein